MKVVAIALIAFLPLVSLAKTNPEKSSAAKRENFAANPEQSKIQWEGKKIIGSGHHGELTLKSGKFEVEKGKIIGGEFVVDMASLKNLDLSDEGMNKKLVTHLKSDDFFSIDKYPTAKIKITKAEHQGNDKVLFSGDLTIKGITKPISFPAEVHMKDDSIHATSSIIVDRTLYNVRYNSLKFFSTIGDKAIDDKFTVKVDILAKR